MKKVFYLLGLILLAVASWWTGSHMFGARGFQSLIVWAVGAWLLVAALVWAARHVSARVWILAGLLNLAGLCLPAVVDVESLRARLGLPYGPLMALVLLVIPCVALITAALLLHSGVNLLEAGRTRVAAESGGSGAQHTQGSRTALGALVLGSLLLAGALYSLYWFVVWDPTDDPLGYLWLPIPALAVLLSSLVLLIARPGRPKAAGRLYLLLIPALVAVFASAQSVDFRRLTEERAERASRAIEAYHARTGHYPQALHQLTPWYVLSFPGPMIMYGQDWCYDAGEDYYRLGYVDRQHWSDPRLMGRIYRMKGKAPELQPMCEEQVIAQQERYPDYPYVYWMEGEQ